MRQLIIAGVPDPSGTLSLSGKDYRYLVQVLRLSAGALLDVRLADGRLVSMRIRDIDRASRSATLSLEGISASGAQGEKGASFGEGTVATQSPRVSPGVSMPPISSAPDDFPAIILFQWILKGPKMDQVFRQATEAGVAIIVPVLGDRCLSLETGGVGQGKAGRWDRIVREARQQSGSAVATRVHDTARPEDITGIWASATASHPSMALVLTEAPLARKTLHEYLGIRPKTVALAIGPEGGMSRRELDLLAAAGFNAVHFRTNILRAETAALYGIAAVQTLILESETWRPHE